MRVGTRETHDRATPRAQTRRRAIGDVFFERSVWLAACAVLALLIAVAAFLVWRSIPAIRQDSVNFLTTRTWLPDDTPPVFGVAAIAFGTALSATVALALAVPVALGSAIFVTQYVPPGVGVWLGYCLDLLAAVPSVVYGLWGMLWLVPAMTPIQRGLATTLGFLPFFADPQGLTRQASRSIFVVGIVLAAMIIPIIAAVTREVIRQVDPGLREAAWALGATRWEMVRLAILPASKLGIAGAVLLGLGRALGETIAVALVLGTSFAVDFHLLVFGKNTIAANIATQFAEAGSLGRSALIASGLVLFAMTMLTTLLARAIIYRSGSRERSAFA